MARTQSAPKAETPAAVKQTAARKRSAPRVVEGPKGKNMPAPDEQHDVTAEQRQGERRQSQTNAVAQFTPATMQTPAAHEPETIDPELVKRQAALEAMKALATSMGVDPAEVLNLNAAAPKSNARQGGARADRESRNNITRPGEGTKTRTIWDAADKISAEKAKTDENAYATIAEVRKAVDSDTNESTLKTQYARWRSYHGLKGRQDPAPKVQEQPSTPMRRASDKEEGAE